MSETDVPLSPEFTRRRLQELGATVMFEKVLTTSDTSGSGRIVIPKSVAEANFPPIDSQDGVVLPLVDLFGRKYGFRYRFWINNASRMYLIEGTQELQTRFKMGVGDVLVFARHPSAPIHVCGRKGTPEDSARKVSAKRAAEKRKSNREAGRAGKRAAAGTAAAGASEAADSGAASAAPGPLGAEGRGGKAGAGAPALPRSKRTKQRAQDAAAAGTGPGGEAGARSEAPQGAPGVSYSYWNAASLPARRDGVFRTVPASAGLEGAGHKVMPQNGLWTAVVSLGGEAFQAFFDSREAAVAACEAAQQTAAG